MVVETINGSQLTPEEVQFLSDELGCSKEEVINGKIPTKPINQQYMPQYNPYQQMQQNMYDHRPQYNPYGTGYQGYGYYNQYGQQYYPSYIQGYTPLYQGQVQGYQYMPITNSYSSGPVCDAYGNWYNNINSYNQAYNKQIQDSYANQVQFAYTQMYRQQALNGNPFENYINLTMNYQPTPNTYFGYYASLPQINMYGFTMTPDDYACYKNAENFLQHQKKIFEDISRGVLKSTNPELPENLDIKQYYQEKLTPTAEGANLEFNMFNFDPEIKKMEYNNNSLNYTLKNLNGPYQEYVKSVREKRMQQQMIETRKQTPENMTLSQFLEAGGNLYREALIEDYKRNYARNLQNSYIQAHYNANVRPPLEDPNYYMSMMKNGQTDIGDISISLPAFLSRNYEERRQKFLSAISNSPKGDGLPF